jgi:hypothetical protein
LTASASSGARIGCVLDIETVPDADAVALAPPSSVGGWRRSVLHRIVAASVIAFEEDAVTGEIRRLRLSTWHAGRVPEPDIIGLVDAALPDPRDERSVLITFNGASHDVPILCSRAMALWMFDLPDLHGWQLERTRHCDLIFGYGARSKRPSLSEVCASFGFQVAVGARERNSARSIEAGDWQAVTRKCEADVAATFIAYAYRRAWELGDARPVASAWMGLSEGIADHGDRLHHLRHFRHHHLVEVARTILAAPAVERGR